LVAFVRQFITEHETPKNLHTIAKITRTNLEENSRKIL